MQILIVDDLKENRLSARFALKNEGYIFIEAENGEEALKVCQENKPDIILIDALMPVMDGFEATKKIRSLSACAQLPILMISSLNQKDDKIKALESGINDFISKPFDKQELIARCRSYTNMLTEVQKRENAEKALKEQHQYLQNIIDTIDDSIMVINADYTIELMNETVKKSLANKNIEDPLHPKCYEVSHDRSTPCEGDKHVCPLKSVFETGSSVKVIHDHGEHGTQEYIELSATPIFDANKNCIGIIETGRDVTTHINTKKRLDMEKEHLDYKVNHDHLTGLANRTLFQIELEQAIEEARLSKEKVAVFFIDLDNFKPINDEHGHEMGDHVLKIVAQRLTHSVRDEDVIARIGGDEFTIVVKGIASIEDIRQLGSKIVNRISQPLKLETTSLDISASIGISISPDDERSAKRLLKLADEAMYKAKKNGKNSVKLYLDTKEK